uniref:Mitofilin n=1 Tax=Rhodosorus marinus TaxID=101924 RepID=A0A7S0BJQ7_9RHOD|mmetsp:Transcript_19043/g.27592  ORF Transcript_19043/g.27592 Transcript_19043/m.27592 type:complete len:289 (+) Transcript_19043:1105-1971(+)
MEERKKIASEALKAVEAVKSELEKKAVQSRAKLEAEIEEEIRVRIAEGEAGLVSMTERQVEEDIQGHKRKLRAQWRDRAHALRAEDQRIREEEHKKRMDLIKSLQERAEMLTETAVHQGEYDRASVAGADSVFKSQEMFHIVEGGQAMQKASRNPKLANGKFDEEGIPSLAELQNQYKRASKESLAAAMIPEGRELTALSWIIAKALSKFKVRSHIPGDNGPNSVLGRAGDALDIGDLQVALSELERLDGLPKELLQDWISDAQGRLMADSMLSLSLQEAEKTNAQLL